MPRSRFTAFAAALLALTPAALLALTACTSRDDTPETTPSTATAPAPAPDLAASVKVADSPLGKILVDGAGRTLYAFTKDRAKAGDSACDADCVAVWPALTATRGLEPGPGLRPALLTETKLAEGAEQAVYGDWPLYYYVGDATAGEVNGQGLDGVWFTVAPDGKLVREPA
ncbi:hypothetical protein GCM10010387_53260 [Streptomyces inusitatus]|uniref:Lipoprotein n=1 Tax=Streptomyces inusitatus TaxID=68221 RepID=A0A918QIJ3_9ACTN|nr:hypothetical protein [Streptomyces inusitatus]GGZ52328.1 hypothetical protein GCM10010387_53260 [Streptomyces inusitatus]